MGTRLQYECDAGDSEVAPGRESHDVAQLLLCAKLMEGLLLHALHPQLTLHVLLRTVLAQLQQSAPSVRLSTGTHSETFQLWDMCAFLSSLSSIWKVVRRMLQMSNKNTSGPHKE